MQDRRHGVRRKMLLPQPRGELDSATAAGALKLQQFVDPEKGTEGIK